MSTAKFRRCHDVTKTWEGGWSDHPADPGGKTMYGVTEAVYHAWLRQHGKPLRPVRQITPAEAEQIYFEQYWMPCGGPTLAAGVDLATYDASVNSGVSRSRKWLLEETGTCAMAGVGRVGENKRYSQVGRRSCPAPAPNCLLV